MDIITTVGASDANSYITVEYADNMVSDLFDDDQEQWLDLNQTQKEHRLIVSAESFRHLPLRGRKVHRDQALSFPRTCQSDTTIIPEIVKVAQVEILFNYINKVACSNNYDMESEGVSRISLAGLISVDFNDTDVSVSNSIKKSVSKSTIIGLSKYLTKIRIFRIGGERRWNA